MAGAAPLTEDKGFYGPEAWFSCELNDPACAFPGTANVLLCESADDRKCFPWVLNQYDRETLRLNIQQESACFTK